MAEQASTDDGRRTVSESFKTLGHCNLESHASLVHDETPCLMGKDSREVVVEGCIRDQMDVLRLVLLTLHHALSKALRL